MMRIIDKVPPEHHYLPQVGYKVVLSHTSYSASTNVGVRYITF